MPTSPPRPRHPLPNRLRRARLLWLQELAAQETAQGIKEKLRLRLFGHLLELGPGALTQQRTGEVTALLTEGVEGLEVYYSRYLPAVFGALLGVLLGLARKLKASVK